MKLKQKPKTSVYFGFIFSCLFAILFLLFSITGCSSQSEEPSKPSLARFSNVEFQVDIADTEKARTKGLSGTKSLDQDVGLLFDFKEEGNYGIWMKDMNYSLDIIWMNKDFKVVHIEESVSPSTYPKTFNSPKPARYVLEINAGLSSENTIKIGDKAEIVEL